MELINYDSANTRIEMFPVIKSKITNERQFVISQFQEEINKERLGTKWKIITGKATAMKLSHIKDLSTLYFFLSECRDYKVRNGSFSKRFFGSLKVRESA